MSKKSKNNESNKSKFLIIVAMFCVFGLGFAVAEGEGLFGVTDLEPHDIGDEIFEEVYEDIDNLEGKVSEIDEDLQDQLPDCDDGEKVRMWNGELVCESEVGEDVVEKEMECSSWDNKFRSCSVDSNSVNIISVSVDDRHSDSSCDFGDSYGILNDRSIYVSDGCRADFEVEYLRD